jgi:TM2 domain-containing membrane protein YozV
MITGDIKMKTFLCLLFFNVLVSGFSQRANPHYQFIEHLLASNRNKEAIALLQFEKGRFSGDTLNFLIGYNQHYLRRPDSATYYLQNVRSTSALYVRARAYELLNRMYAKDYASLNNQHNSVLASGDQQVFYMLDAARMLLKRDHAAFDSVAVLFRFDDHKYSAEQQNLVQIRKQMVERKQKSPYVAGLLSAAVPGLGKFYAGKKGAALAAFASNIVLAGFALESYYRGGPKSPQFIVFGTIFTFFYTGNIFGSVYSVKQQIRSTNGRINNEILATIHISVDRLYSK